MMNGNNPIVNDVEDIKTVTYFQNQPIQQQWFMIVSHDKIPMFNAPEQRYRRQAELKSIAKSIQMDPDRRKLMMKITNNDNDEQHSLELKFYLPNDYRFEYSIDCRRIDLFRRSKKDRTYFYFTLECNIGTNNNIDDDGGKDSNKPTQEINSSNQQQQRKFQYECHMYHAISISNAEFIADLMDKQVQLNLKNQKKFLQSSSSTNVENKQKQTKQSSKQSNDDDKNGKNVVKSELVSKKILPEIENVRTAHPLDRSLDDDVIMAINHVPSLLDLGLSSKTTSTMTMETKNNHLNNNQFDLDFIDITTVNEMNKSSQATNIHNPFLSVLNPSPMTTSLSSDWNIIRNEQQESSSSSSSSSSTLSSSSSTSLISTIISKLSMTNSNSTINLPQLLSNNNSKQMEKSTTTNPLDYLRFDDDFDTFISKKISNELMQKQNHHQ